MYYMELGLTHFKDLKRCAGEDLGEGALWGFESQDLDCTLVAWNKGAGVAKHTNDEVDVVMLVLEGRALIELEDKRQELMEGQLLILRKGAPRRIEALSDRVVYLNIHKRRKPMGLSEMDSYRERKPASPK